MDGIIERPSIFSKQLWNRTLVRTFNLSTRQMEAASALVQGWLDKEIARGMDISRNVAKEHVRVVILKTGSKSRGQAVYKIICAIEDMREQMRRESLGEEGRLREDIAEVLKGIHGHERVQRETE